MATNLLAQVTLDHISVAELDSDPSVGGLTLQNIGSIGLLYDGTHASMWLNYGASATNWRRILAMEDSTSLTLGSIPYINANGNLAQDNANLFWDATDHRLGIGTTAPLAAIHVATTSDVSMILTRASTGGNLSPGISFRAERGTIGTPTTVATTDWLGKLDYNGWDGSAYVLTSRIIGIVNGAVSTGVVPTDLSFLTGPGGASSIERMRISSAGQVIVSSSNASPQDITGSSAFPLFQIIGTSSVQMAGIQFSADTIGPVFNLLKSRNASVNTQGLVSSGDEFGRIQFRASDGVNFQAGASIRGIVDGTAAANSMPGRLIFMTTPSGSVTPVERVRFDNSGIMTLAVGKANSSTNTTSVSGTYTVVATDLVLMVTTSSAVTINLPDPATRRVLWIKDISGLAETNHIILHRFGSESIEGVALDKTMRANSGGWMIASDGTNWYIL